MVVYDDLEAYEKYKSDFHRFKKIKVLKTKHSIKIDYGKKKVFLNKDTGKDKTNILGLINRVKKDSENFINKVDFVPTKANDIFWYYYNDNSDIVKDNIGEFDVAKIDLSSAYWTKAINEKIIGKDTVKYFESLDFENVKEKKGARLKALGSLATVKSTEIYEYGKRSSEVVPLIVNENFRALYMGICDEVARDMQTVLSYFDGVYYYWDCIFVKPENTKGVEDMFSDLGYNCTVEQHKAKVFKSKYISYLSCPNKDGKIIEYPIKNE
jgi:hypothetical protein